MTAIGHLGQDAIVREVNGKKVINFSLAHTEKYRDSSGIEKQSTTWIECNWWTDKTTIVPYLKKGTQIYVEGIPGIRQWDKDGKVNSNMVCRIISIQLLGNKSENQSTQNNNTGNSTVNTGAYVAPDNPDLSDLPF